MQYNPVAASDLFECIRCGDCCRGYGGTFVTDEDIQAIADFLNMTAETVRDRYCVLSGGKPLLVQGADGFCVFWDRVCTIHPVKPRMCRRWPFIPSILTDPANWRIMAGSCPGIRTEVDDRALQSCVREVLADRSEWR